MAPDARVKDLLEAAPSSLPLLMPSNGCRSRFFGKFGRRVMQFLSLGDLFFISAATGTLLLVEIGVLIIVGVI
ncbi:hypothetical protein XH99_31270 [Bradyrhizobium nanningense]|uniref:Uncharacterized protein n=1 Tax=Bradyrhizobium nanningense TaxID=1325118 RepID=A0A4Q0RUD5_9BRAD|nr:hypothetical protein XH99_31270 [Bradyrhizobium nanningense]